MRPHACIGLELIAVSLLVSLAAVTTQAAPPVQHNPADPPAREQWTLRETWRHGGDPDDLLLGQVGVVISGPEGEVYALDSQLAHVQVFDAQGRHLRTIGREGEGPGEFRQPTGLCLGADGRLAVQQTFPGRLVYLDAASGEPHGQWTLGKDSPQAGGFALLLGHRERAGVRVASATISSFDMAAGAMRSTRYLALLDPAGQELRRLAEQATSHGVERQVRDDLAEHFAGDRGLWDIGAGGRIYLVPRYDEYHIDVHDAAGQLAFVITRDHDARLRSDEEKAEQRSSLNMNIGGRTVDIDWKQHDRARSIERLQVLDDGTVWVINSEGSRRWADHGERVYDVFDAQGRLLREVTVTVPEGGKGHRLALLDDGRFLLIKGLESISLMVGASSDGTTSAMRQDTAGDAMHELVCFEPAP